MLLKKALRVAGKFDVLILIFLIALDKIYGQIIEITINGILHTVYSYFKAS